MSCQEQLDFLGDYIEGALATDVRERFDAHLASCQPCQRYLEEYRAAIALGRRAGADELGVLPDDLVHAILDAARK
jgi:anti-sigma factor RsiW